jgi:hypothetical protein
MEQQIKVIKLLLIKLGTSEIGRTEEEMGMESTQCRIWTDMLGISEMTSAMG